MTSAWARFTDYATVISTDPVTVRLGTPLTYIIGGTGSTSGATHLRSNFTINGMQVSDGQILEISPGSPVTIDGVVQASLSFGAGVPALRGSLIYDRVYMDVSHTANFYIDVLTPGARLLTESGHDYSSPQAVSEPATGLLLGLGSLTIGMLVRRRRSQTSRVQ